jgi:hypothetical protein
MGDVLGVCSRLVEEGILSGNLTAECSRIVEDALISSNLTSTGSNLPTQIVNSGAIEANLSQDLTSIGSTFSGDGFIGQLVAYVMRIIDYMLSSLKVVLGWMGLSFTSPQENLLAMVLSVIILAALLDYFVKLFGKWAFNSIAGLAVLFILHYLFGVSIPITLFTLVAVAAFGIPGLLALIVLHLGGML